MTSTQSFAFIFAYANKAPRDKDAAFKIRAVHEQLLNVGACCLRNGWLAPRFRAEVSTYRRRSFAESQGFTEVVREARQSASLVLVADIGSLLRKVTPSKLNRALTILDGSGDLVFDCLSGRAWAEFLPDERIRFMQEGVARKISKRVVGKRNADIAPGQAKAGAAANRKRANNDAKRLRPILEAMKANLPPGASLTPSAVAHHLNKIGEKPKRGTAWSHNSARNLLLRLGWVA